MQNFLNKNLIKKTLLILFFIELLSFLSHVFPSLNIVSFFILIIFTLILSIKDLKYGVIIVLVELLISSKGYLFYLEFDENKFPIRIALWGIVMYVWFIQEIYNFIKNKKIDLSQYDKKYIYYLIGLLVFVLCGIVNGFLNNNFKSNIFNDVNAWFYFLLIFPVLKTLSTNENKKLFLNYFLIGTSWTSLKTLFLFYLFTHDFSFLGLVYKWIRDTGVGEITRMQGGFYRIFFQTHIFIILAFFISFNYLLALYKQKTKYHNLYITFFGLSVLFLSVNILNFSRSNWLGILFGFVMYTLIIFWVHGVKNLFYYFKNIFKVLFFSFIIFYLIIEF
ncbi:hypothetical protein KAI92_04460, partial [Candidatus Parcubacteria bacterium]|nr:hypothetical protein [Candidatus Parcubacteria bacterium]